MSNWNYVFNCLFRTEECDEFGMDCCICPYYDRNEDEEEKSFWDDEE